jgi:hypothetical protein
MTQGISRKTGGPAIRYPNKKKLALVLIATVALAACTKDGNQTGSPQQEGQAVSSQSHTGKLDVKILPGAPTVLTDLHALYSGKGTATYQWQKDGQPLVGENSLQLSKSKLSKGDRISVVVTAGDEQGEASVTITIGNSPPTVTSIPFSPEHVYAGVDITVAPVGSDPDADAVGYRCHWAINDQEVPEDTPVLKGALFKRGDKINLVVIPYDQDGDGKPLVSQNMIIPNGPPKIISDPPEFHGSTYAYQVIAEDPDGDPLTYSLFSAPPGMSIDVRTGMISWIINEKSAGTHGVEVIVQDPGGLKASQKYSLTMTVTDQGAGR